jgi:hypothetical protein
MILGSAAYASSLAFFLVPNHQCHDVGVKRYFDPSDTELLRALHSRNSKNIRNLLIFLQKMASYSCFWRVPRSKILLQASLHRIYDLLTLVSCHLVKHRTFKLLAKSCFVQRNIC